jgi:hypothetical protein
MRLLKAIGVRISQYTKITKSSAYLGQFSTQLATVPLKSEDFFGAFFGYFLSKKTQVK